MPVILPHDDLLDAISRGIMSAEEAEDRAHEIADTRHGDLRELLGMSSVEYTAYAHGASLVQIARWRRDGWPSHCAICGRNLDVPQFGWVPREIEPVFVLVHIACLLPRE
jgi:hypothetical protein